MMTRASEDAEQWREEIRRRPGSLELPAALDTLDGDALNRAHRTWWATYARGVQSAPSRRRGYGISPGDAGAAAAAADAAVLTECSPKPHSAAATRTGTGPASHDVQTTGVTR